LIWGNGLRHIHQKEVYNTMSMLRVHLLICMQNVGVFESMTLSFGLVGLVPKVEHYSCMVDLCARAGLLNEAWDLINKML